MLLGRVVSSRLWSYGSVVAVWLALLVALAPDVGRPPESAMEMLVDNSANHVPP
jgi:hypothetical protein